MAAMTRAPSPWSLDVNVEERPKAQRRRPTRVRRGRAAAGHACMLLPSRSQFHSRRVHGPVVHRLTVVDPSSPVTSRPEFVVHPQFATPSARHAEAEPPRSPVHTDSCQNGKSCVLTPCGNEKQEAPLLSPTKLASRYAALAAILVGLAVLVLPPPAAAALLPISCDSDVPPYVANGTFQANLNLLQAALPANTSASPAGFATASVGAAPDQANGLALCRGDINASSCAACVAAAFRDARQACPLDKGAAVYRDACVLRFASMPFLDFLREDQWITSELVASIDSATGSVNVTDAAWFDAAVTGIFAALIDRAAAAAASKSTRKYFATGEMDFDPKIYGLAQCAPDLTPVQCRDCLGQLAAVTTEFQRGEPPSNSNSAFVVWCQLRYGVLPLYDGRAMLQLPAPPQPPPETTLAPPTSESGSAPKMVGRGHSTIFDMPTLQEATEHFSEKNKLGEGSYGTVYKGLLSDGQEIAVMTLLGGTGQGLHQLHNEVLVLAELQHKNLVRLHGFCSHENDILLLYEFIKNGSLDNFLFDDRGTELNWGQQHKIILGIAKGILYLHEDSGMRIIHHDLKANNILLDDDMQPKIARSGLAGILVGEGNAAHTRTSRVVGTSGYMAPEYAMHGSVSPKIDVFSFGVLALEIATRRRYCRFDDHGTVNLLSDVWGHWTRGTVSQMLHQSLDGYAENQALRCIHIGFLCVQQDPDHRPDIATVVFMLSRDSMDLQPPSQPAFFFGRESPPASLSSGQNSYLYDSSDFVPEQGISVNGITLPEPYLR